MGRRNNGSNNGARMAKVLRRLFAGMAAACSAAAMAAPQLVWLEPVHDFGAFREETGLVSCTFRAVNTGDEPAVVVDARANCGCTRPIYSKAPVAPGDTLKVTVSFNPAGRPGRFHKQVKVTTNAEGRTAVLGVKGTVIGASNTLRSRYPVEAHRLRISGDVCPFGETRKGRVLASAINIYNPTGDTVVPAVKNIPPYIHALIRPKHIAPGEQATVSLTAYTDRCPQWDLVEDSLTFVPDSRRPDETVKVSTVMIINEDFSKLTPAQLEKAPVAVLDAETADFGVIDRNGVPVEKRLRIANRGHEPLMVRRLYCTDRAVEVKIQSMKIKPGKSEEIEITVNPALMEPGSPLNARINLITNDPASPRRTLRAVGE